MTTAQDFLPQLASISESFHEAKTKYMNDHKTFQVGKDARLTIYTRCLLVIDNALLYLVFQTFDIPSDSWWDTLSKIFTELGINPLTQKPSPDNRKSIMATLNIYWQYSAFIVLVSTLESFARTIVRKAYPGKCNDGRGKIMDIYNRLLGRKFSNYECLLKLLTLGRNTMHNNGVYFPNRKGDNRHVTYKNVAYDFIDGQSVQYGNLTKLVFFDIAPDMLKMINDIVNSPKVSIHAQIIDPSEK